MNKLILFFLGSVFALINIHAQTADEIVNKYLAAMGGKEKLATIKTIYQESSTNIRGVASKNRFWCVNNKAYRWESEINGLKNYSVLRNDSGWFFNPRRGQKAAEPMTGEAVRRSQLDLDMQSPLLDYAKKGYTIKYEGKDDAIDGSDTYKLELKVNDSLSLTYYIDPDSYLIMRMKTKKIVNGKTETSNQDFSNYLKNADGYVFAMQINRTKYSLIKVNPDIDAALFNRSTK
jgi:hypothetical protein